MARIIGLLVLLIAAVTPAMALLDEPPMDAEQIMSLVCKRFPGCNRALWLDENTVDFGDQKGAYPHKRIQGWTRKVGHNPPRLLQCRKN
jgi:hypothetical protein